MTNEVLQLIKLSKLILKIKINKCLDPHYTYAELLDPIMLLLFRCLAEDNCVPVYVLEQ